LISKTSRYDKRINANYQSSSPTMARCSAAKETGNPHTNFMAAGEQALPTIEYGKQAEAQA
jgi:hypothetical protein